jgi:hypothetical protein
MSTTGPDLEAGRLAVEALFDDECIIRRDPGGDLDDTLDLSTGQLTRPVGHPKVIYTGRCKVTKQQAQTRNLAEGGRAIAAGVYSGGIPVDSPMPKTGDTLTVTSSRRDPSLVKQEFRVGEVYVSTFAISRKFELVLRHGVQ